MIDRDQMPMFSPTLGEMIPEDHPVRLYDEVLRQIDWSDWEAGYHGLRGQPPIHPRVVASVILYGLNRRINSSRGLEDACRHRIDFMWLAEGRKLDHSTICGFRKAFGKQLKTLFRQVGKLAFALGMIRLLEVGIDGTRIRSNNSRYKTATAPKLKQQLAELNQLLDDMASRDDEDEADGDDDSDHHLPAELATQEKRRKKLEEALATVQERDAARRKRVGTKAKASQVPVTDPDSMVLPNKDGGFAPNYTPIAVTDGHHGLIVDAEVIDDSSEASVAVPALDRTKKAFGKYPDRVMMDGAYGTGPNLESMESRGLDVLTPVGHPAKTNPALREDPTQPVSEEQWSELPRNGQKKLDKTCFVYIESKDVYYCPTGQVLTYEQTNHVERDGGTAHCRVYKCRNCEGCPLSRECLTKRSAGRSVRRDQYEDHRERMAAKMRREESQESYAARMAIAETPFGHIKNVMNIRQFCLRGLDNVKIEWTWICTAHNLAKMIRHLGELRARFRKLALG